MEKTVTCPLETKTTADKAFSLLFSGTKILTEIDALLDMVGGKYFPVIRIIRTTLPTP